MPVEFSAAAYRLGHSMVRQRYSHNQSSRGGCRHLQLLFDFTGLSGGIIGDLAPNPPTAPTPVDSAAEQLDHRLAPLLRVWVQAGGACRRQCRAQARPVLVRSLHTLPGGGGNLAFRNLKRGVMLGLPSGQDVAKHMKIKNPLTPAEIASDSNGSTDGAVAKKHGLHTAHAALVLHPQGGQAVAP